MTINKMTINKMNINKHARRSFLGLCLMTVAMPNGVVAADDEIIVTAQLREQSLQDVPISIDVLGADEIADKRISDIVDIGYEVPGLQIYTFVPRQVNPTIRGAASLTDSPGVDQSVAMFLDGVYIGQTGFYSFDLFDVERIEVLKGPQGTLFGRNVTGGALNVVTSNPPEDFDATIEASLGNYGRRDVQGVVGGPLTDRLAAQVAFSSKNSDGFYTNVFDGKDVGSLNTFSLRGKLRYEVSDDAEIILSAEHSTDKQDGIGFDLEGAPLPYMGTEAFGPNKLVNLNNPGDIDNEILAFTGTVNVGASIGTITSITAYREADNFISVDADGTPVVEIDLADGDKIKQFSQELRLTGEVNNFQYVGGLFFINIDHERSEYREFDGAPGSAFELFAWMGDPVLDIQGQTIKTKSYAAYAELTYAFDMGLSLTGGVRYTKDDKSGSTFCSTGGSFILCPSPTLTVSHDGSWDAVTPRFVAQYEASDDVMFYGSVSRGFKSGGFPLNIADPNPDAEFKPEYVNNYEVGMKSRFFDRRLQMNVALYKMDFTDLQVLSQSDAGAIFAANAGEAKTLGAEIDLNAQVTDALTLYGDYSFTDQEFKDLELEGEDLSGNTMRNLPKHSFNIGATYTWDLGDAGAVSMRANVLHTSRYFLSVDNDPNLSAKVNGVINSGISYTTPDEHWEFSLWVKNLTDKRFFVTQADRGFFIQPLGTPGDTYTGRYNEPRTFGGTVRWNY